MDDDEPVGELLSRRQAVGLAGAPVLAVLAGCSTGDDGTTAAGTDSTITRTSTSTTARTSTTTEQTSKTTADESHETTDGPTSTPRNACVARPEMVEGPFFVNEKLRRSDVRTDTSTGETKDGVRLDLRFEVYEVGDDGRCRWLPGAHVQIWQADAMGVYSAEPSEGTADRDFLRGYQVTTPDATASFTTVYPGWYPGRTPHVHFKIRSSLSGEAAYDFTSQLFFREERSDRVYDREPYATRPERDTRHAGDSIFQRSGGEEMVLDLRETADGLEATFAVALYTDGGT